MATATFNSDVHPLADRVAAVGRRAKRLWFAHAIAWTVALIVAAMATVIALDQLARFRESGLRWLGSLAVVGVAAWAVWRFIRPATRAIVSPVMLAQQVERRFPQLGDRLSSAIAFLSDSTDDEQAGSTDLRRVVIASATADAQPLDWNSVLDPAPARRAIGWAALVTLVVAALAARDPAAAAIGVARLAQPWGGPEWPRHHQLTIEHPIDRLAAGGTFEITVTDRRGAFPEDARIHFRYEGEDAAHDSEPLVLRGDRWVFRRESVARSFAYRVTGGDDDTMPERWLEVVRPPEVTAIKLTVHPPAYTGWSPYPTDRAISALAKSTIAVDAQVDRPLARGVVVLESGRRIDAIVTPDGLSFAIAANDPQGWIIDGSNWYALGLTERGEQPPPAASLPRWEMHPVVDRPPTGQLTEPADVAAASPTARLTIRATAKDDLAIRRVTLSYKRLATAGATPQSATIFAGPSPLDAASAGSPLKPGPLRELTTLAHELDLAALRLSPGEQLELALEVEDYAGQVTLSTPRRLLIISPSQLEQRLADRQAKLLADLGRALAVQKQAIEHTTRLRSPQAPRPASREWTDAAAADQLLQKQVGRLLVDRGDGVVAQAETLLAELARNRLTSGAMHTRITSLVKDLGQLSQGPLVELEHQFERLLRPEAKGTDELAAIAPLQTRVANELQRLADEWGPWGDLQRIAQTVADIRRQQTDLARRTAELAASTLGQATNDLSAAQQADLTQQSTAQWSLAALLDRVAAQIEAGRQKLASQDSPAVAVLTDASDRLRTGNAVGRMREAGDDIRDNRLGRATQSQTDVIAELDALAAILTQRNESAAGREAKSLDETAAELERIRREQEGLRKKAKQLTAKPPSPERDRAMKEIERQQRELADAARRLERTLQRLQARQAAKAVGEAARQMDKAADQDRAAANDKSANNPAASAADAAREQAAAALKSAGSEIADAKEQADRRQRVEAAQQLSRDVQALEQRQSQLLGQTIELDRHRPGNDAESIEKKTWRGGVADAAQLQRGLANDTTKLAAATKADVAAAALAGAADDMQRAAQRLATDQPDDATQTAQIQARDRLKQLREALQPNPADLETSADDPTKSTSPKDKPDEKKPDDKRPRRSLAELRLLLSMQESVNRRTKELEARRQPGKPLTPAEEQEYDQLSKEQGRLAELLLKLTTTPAPKEGARDAPPQDLPAKTESGGGEKDRAPTTEQKDSATSTTKEQ